MTLTEFLLARIAEDQEYAYQAQGLSGIVTDWHTIEKLRERGLTRADARHVAHWSSARVLAKCEAKWRIVAYCDTMIALDGEPNQMRAGDARVMLRALALPYADHPYYQQEWKN